MAVLRGQAQLPAPAPKPQRETREANSTAPTHGDPYSKRRHKAPKPAPSACPGPLTGEGAYSPLDRLAMYGVVCRQFEHDGHDSRGQGEQGSLLARWRQRGTNEIPSMRFRLGNAISKRNHRRQLLTHTTGYSASCSPSRSYVPRANLQSASTCALHFRRRRRWPNARTRRFFVLSSQRRSRGERRRLASLSSPSLSICCPHSLLIISHLFTSSCPLPFLTSHSPTPVAKLPGPHLPLMNPLCTVGSGPFLSHRLFNPPLHYPPLLGPLTS